MDIHIPEWFLYVVIASFVINEILGFIRHRLDVKIAKHNRDSEELRFQREEAYLKRRDSIIKEQTIKEYKEANCDRG